MKSEISRPHHRLFLSCLKNGYEKILFSAWRVRKKRMKQRISSKLLMNKKDGKCDIWFIFRFWKKILAFVTSQCFDLLLLCNLVYISFFAHFIFLPSILTDFFHQYPANNGDKSFLVILKTGFITDGQYSNISRRKDP